MGVAMYHAPEGDEAQAVLIAMFVVILVLGLMLGG
jgi:hypothetical protein